MKSNVCCWASVALWGALFLSLGVGCLCGCDDPLVTLGSNVASDSDSGEGKDSKHEKDVDSATGAHEDTSIDIGYSTSTNDVYADDTETEGLEDTGVVDTVFLSLLDTGGDSSAAIEWPIAPSVDDTNGFDTGIDQLDTDEDSIVNAEGIHTKKILNSEGTLLDWGG